jgi:hypothetical protein
VTVEMDLVLNSSPLLRVRSTFWMAGCEGWAQCGVRGAICFGGVVGVGGPIFLEDGESGESGELEDWLDGT